MPIVRDDRPFVIAVGRRLRRARREAGISQRELARLVGLRPGTISAIETGKSLPPTDTVLLILRVLGRPLDDVLSGIKWVPRKKDTPGHWHDQAASG